MPGATASLLSPRMFLKCSKRSRENRRSLHSGMREAEKHAIQDNGPRDLDVFELTLRGIARKHQFSPDATRAARSDLEEAIRRDPNYAPAWTYLASVNLIADDHSVHGRSGTFRGSER